MSCPTNCTCQQCTPCVPFNPCATVPTCNTCGTCSPCAQSLPVSPNVTYTWECDGCTTLALKQLNNPCYENLGPCLGGCEESLKTNCIIVGNAQLGGLQIESGVSLEVALRNADYRFQELANAINVMVPGSIISYSYRSTCPLVTISSLKKNGVETLSAPVTTNRSGILGILQGADPLWLMTPTNFLISGTDVWEIVLTCN